MAAFNTRFNRYWQARIAGGAGILPAGRADWLSMGWTANLSVRMTTAISCLSRPVSEITC